MKSVNKITSIQLENYGMIKKFSCEEFSDINLIIGKNGMGKTFLILIMT